MQLWSIQVYVDIILNAQCNLGERVNYLWHFILQYFANFTTYINPAKLNILTNGENIQIFFI